MSYDVLETREKNENERDTIKGVRNSLRKRLIAGSLAAMITLTPMLGNSQKAMALDSHRLDFGAITWYHSKGNQHQIGMYKNWKYYGVDKQGALELAETCDDISNQLAFKGTGPSYNPYILLAKGIYYIPREMSSKLWKARANTCRAGANKNGVTVTAVEMPDGRLWVQSIKINK